jgi:hypothetical protein
MSGSFHRPENYDPYKDLSGKHWQLWGGSNDWEDLSPTYLWVDLDTSNGLTRVWLHVQHPESVYKGETKTADIDDLKARAKRVAPLWVKCMRLAKAEDEHPSDSAAATERYFVAALKREEMNGFVKDHGVDVTRWATKSAATAETIPTTGPEAIAHALRRLDPQKLEDEMREIVRSRKVSKRPRAVDVISTLHGLKRNNLTPADLMISAVPVIPAQFRPFAVVGDTFTPGDANELYRDLFKVRDAYEEARGELGDEGTHDARLHLYDAVRSVFGFREPVEPKTLQRGVSGFLQKITGVNPKYCHDDATEILTQGYGWQSFKDLKEDTKVATVNPATLEFEWQQPTAYYHYDYNGEMIHIVAGFRVDALVTPTHEMWVKNRGRVLRAEEVTEAYMRSGWSKEFAYKTISSTGRRWFQTSTVGWKSEFVRPDFVPTGAELAFAQLVGYYAAEGWIHTDGKMACLCQSPTANPEYCQTIEGIAQRTGIRYSCNEYPEAKKPIIHWNFQCEPLAAWLRVNVGQGSENKTLSREIVDWPAEMLSAMFKAYLEGDGSKRNLLPQKNGGHTHKFRNPFTDSHDEFVTVSKSLFDAMQEVGLKLGLTVYRRKDYPHLRRPGQQESYQGAVVGRWNCVTEGAGKCKAVWYKGGVHCCTVPNGLLITRRNTKVLVSGNSYVQRTLLAKPMDTVGRGVIGVDPDLGLDEVGVPKEMAWRMYAPYIQSKLVQGGMSPGDAVKAIRDRTDFAYHALQQVAKRRPVIYSRAPSWHKFNVIAGHPRIIDGDTIMINAFVGAGLGGDHDGDAINVHVPSMDDAVAEAHEKLMPSRMLFSDRDYDKILPQPKHEHILGLSTASYRPSAKSHTFPSEAAALAAARKGQVSLNDDISYPGMVSPVGKPSIPGK